MKFTEYTNLISNEIKDCLLKINPDESQNLVNEILNAEKVFLIAVGRVSLSLQCFGKRLSHLGINVELVGSLTEKPATKNDLLIVASGSGESILPVNIAKKASDLGTKIGLITSAESSSLKDLCDFYVTLNSPTKSVSHGNIPNQSLSDSASKSSLSVQPMSSLFDQALHIYGDVISMIIFEQKNIDKEELWKYHANLE